MRTDTAASKRGTGNGQGMSWDLQRSPFDHPLTIEELATPTSWIDPWLTIAPMLSKELTRVAPRRNHRSDYALWAIHSSLMERCKILAETARPGALLADWLRETVEEHSLSSKTSFEGFFDELRRSVTWNLDTTRIATFWWSSAETDDRASWLELNVRDVSFLSDQDVAGLWPELYQDLRAVQGPVSPSEVCERIYVWLCREIALVERRSIGTQTQLRPSQIADLTRERILSFAQWSGNPPPLRVLVNLSKGRTSLRRETRDQGGFHEAVCKYASGASLRTRVCFGTTQTTWARRPSDNSLTRGRARIAGRGDCRAAREVAQSAWPLWHFGDGKVVRHLSMGNSCWGRGDQARTTALGSRFN